MKYAILHSTLPQQRKPKALRYHLYSTIVKTNASISQPVTAKRSAFKYLYLSSFVEFVDVVVFRYSGFPTVLGWMDVSPEKVMTNHEQRLTSMRLDLRNWLLLTTLKDKSLFLYLKMLFTKVIFTFCQTRDVICIECLSYTL